MIPAMAARRNIRWCRAPLTALFALAALALPHAHDLERTTVHLQVSADGSFTLRLAHDPSWLLLRMESFAGGAATTSTSDAVARDARLRELAPQIIERIVLFVDGHEVRPVSAEVSRRPPLSRQANSRWPPTRCEGNCRRRREPCAGTTAWLPIRIR